MKAFGAFFIIFTIQAAAQEAPPSSNGIGPEIIFSSGLSSSHASYKTGSTFSKYKGKKIRKIEIKIFDIFENENEYIYGLANDLKVKTRTEVVARELLFKEGDQLDPFKLEETERILRTLRFIRNIEIVPLEDGEFIDLTVKVQDTWTLIPQFNYSSGDGDKRTSVGIVDSNIAGYGKRFELLFEEERSRNSVETVYEDQRFLGSFHKLVLAYFDRDDGSRTYTSIGRPFRTLLDSSSWDFTTDNIDGVGRLYENGDERYIFHQKNLDLSTRYTTSVGNAALFLRRYTIGYDFIDHDFSQADESDYDSLDLDPNQVSNDIAELPEDRKYSGPVVVLEKLEPDYISANYVDRFDRVEDYNLGERGSLTLNYAAEALGSYNDALFYSIVNGVGYRFKNSESFIIGEVGFAGRYDQDNLGDSISRGEIRYYNILGPQYFGKTYLGKHTIAANLFLDIGHDLNRDRVLYIGGDNCLRGYESKTFDGDKRWCFTLEDRVHIKEDIYKLVSFGAAAFVDVGGATYGSPNKLIGDEMYGDFGVGLRFAFPRSSGGSVLRVDLAFPMRDGPDGSGRLEIRAIFSGGQLFNSRLRSESLGTENANIGVGLDR
jgi:outer membrane protein assembly factor BamA